MKRVTDWLMRGVALPIILTGIGGLLAACGQDTEGDQLPNVLTGGTGVVLVVLIVGLVWRALRKKGKKG